MSFCSWNGSRHQPKVSLQSMYEDWLSGKGHYDLPYVNDIHSYMKVKESKRDILLRSPQLAWRSTLINLLKLACKELKLSTLVFHLSILLMDHFMDNHSIVNEKLRPIAITCLSLAAKYEEMDEKIPKASDFAKLCKNLSLSQLKSYELMVIEHFGWSLGAPTTAHFLLYYSHNALPSISEHLRPALNASILAYLEVSVCDPTMTQYRSSVVAATCILCGRREIGLKPLWTTYLTHLTGYSYKDLEKCQNHLLSSMKIPWTAVQSMKRKREGSDKGYESMSPNDDGKTSDGKMLKLSA